MATRTGARVWRADMLIEFGRPFATGAVAQAEIAYLKSQSTR